MSGQTYILDLSVPVCLFTHGGIPIKITLIIKHKTLFIYFIRRLTTVQYVDIRSEIYLIRNLIKEYDDISALIDIYWILSKMCINCGLLGTEELLAIIRNRI